VGELGLTAADSVAQIYALQARGLAEGQTPSESIEEMASLYLESVWSVQPRGPYLLSGWSMGGGVAFEMARQLRAQGEEVALVALFDSHAAGPQGVFEMDEAARVSVFARDLVRSAGALLSDAALASQSPEELLKHLTDEAQGQGLSSPYGGETHLSALWKVFDSNLRASARYVPSTKRPERLQ